MTTPENAYGRYLTDERKKFWKDRNVFITGGFGLLGSTIVEMLDQMGARVFALKRDHIPSSRLFETEAIQRVGLVRGDIESYDTMYRSLNEHEIDTVFHVAAQPLAPIANRAPLPTLRTNVMGTCNVLEACRVSPTVKRVLVASSDKAYGAQPVLPYDESASLHGLHPYDASKSCTDLLSQMYYNTYKLPVAITRCGNLYGPGDLNFNRIIPGTIRDVLANRQPVIRSDGKFIRDYFFVRDAANAYLTLAENMERQDVVGQPFNFSTGNRFSVIDIVERILEVMDAKGTELNILNEAKAEIHDQTLSSAKAKRVLDWEPKYTVEEGLAETVAWYKRYLSEGVNAHAKVAAMSEALLS